MDVGAVNSHFSVYLATFGMVSPNINKQPGDPKATLLLTNEKAVFYNVNQGEHWKKKLMPTMSASPARHYSAEQDSTVTANDNDEYKNYDNDNLSYNHLIT